jgi:membrane associated rhomboid family serine protease
MGFENRDYYREDEGSGSFIARGGDLSITWRLIILCAGLFLTNLFIAGQEGPQQHWLTKQWLALHGDAFSNPLHWHQFLTYTFTHDPTDIGHIFWTMLPLYFFGSEMERMYGRREYLRFFLVTALLGGVFWCLRMTLMMQQGGLTQPQLAIQTVMGANGPVTALTLLFCMHFPHRQIYIFGVLPIPAWAIGGLTILGNMPALLTTHPTPIDPCVVGILFALLYFRFHWNLGQLPAMEFLSSLPSRIGTLFKPRPQLKVFDSDDQDDDAYAELEKEADRILDKLHREGEQGLSAHERKLLERYSRLMRQKHR